MTQSHTPTPWDINAYNLTDIIKVNPGADHEGKTYVDGRHSVKLANTMGADHLTWGERHANAAFIVRACNAFADLVFFAENASHLDDCCTMTGAGSDICDCGRDTALAKAKAGA